MKKQLFNALRALRRFAGRVSGREAKRFKKEIRDLRSELALRDQHALEQELLYQQALAKIPAATDQVHLAEYSDLVPSPTNALTMFPGTWSSSLPDGAGPGSVPLFEDHRIAWLCERLGSITDWRVLELGPLEGGHTYMLEKGGAQVTAIEGNHDSFLRCLITKNLLALKSEFVLGDFAKSFGEGKSWDLVIASGVLYHMTDPVDLIRRIAAASDRVFLWTHYFHPETELWNESVRDMIGTKWRPDLMRTIEVGDLKVRIVPQSYGDALGWDGFCGGPEAHSNWIYRADLLQLIAGLGFRKIEIAFDHPEHPNGPAFCVLAQK